MTLRSGKEQVTFMKGFRLIIVSVFVAAFVSIAGAQSRMVGRVVSAVDGKTVVMEVDGRKLVAEIQYIEVPEAEQPLYNTVREHLAKLTVTKTAEFRPQGFAPGKAFGQLYIGTTDVAVQMLRDGAAWHIKAEKSGQKAAESEEYLFQQEQAKQEKRGVWGVAGMTPAWEFRAAKLDRERQAQIAAEYAEVKAEQAKTAPSESAKAQPRRSGVWSDKNPWLQNPGPLVHGYNAASKTGYVGTSLLGVREMENQPAGQKTAVDITYLYKQDDGKSRTGKFVLSVISAADDWRFLKSNNLIVTVDEKSHSLGKPKRIAAKEEGRSVEKLTYEVNKETIEKIVYGGEVFVRIGDYMLFPTQTLQLLLYNMLQVAE